MKKLLLKSIKFYQKTLFFNNEVFKSFFLSDKMCRFEPTCSNFTYQAIDKYGVPKGVYMGVKRILRCHPWAKGGYDPVK